MLKDQTKKIKWIKNLFFFYTLITSSTTPCYCHYSFNTSGDICHYSFVKSDITYDNKALILLESLLATATTLFNTSGNFCYYSITTIDIVFLFFCKLTIDIVDITNNNKTSLQKAILILYDSVSIIHSLKLMWGAEVRFLFHSYLRIFRLMYC